MARRPRRSDERGGCRPLWAARAAAPVGGMVTVPSSRTVFYLLPVNENEAGEALIRERFGAGAELARWIVENRIR